MYSALSQSPIFKGLEENEVKSIISSTHYNIYTYKPEEIIAIAGEEVISIMIILEGSIKTELVNEAGRSFSINEFNCSKVLAPGFIYGTNNYFPVNVIAKEKTKILVIPKQSFTDIISKNQLLLTNYLNILSNKAQFLVSKIKNTFLQPIETKIASYLINKAKENNSNEFILEHSHEWLAQHFWATRPSVSRVFSNMNSKGYINQKGKKIKLNDIEGLKACIKNL